MCDCCSMGIPARRARDRLLDYGKKITTFTRRSCRTTITITCRARSVSPVVSHAGVCDAGDRSRLRFKLGKLKRLEHFEAGQTLRFADVAVHTFATP